MSYSDYQNFLFSDNITNVLSSGALNKDVSNNYIVTYSILNDKSDVSDTGSYLTTDDEETFFATSYNSGVQSAFLGLYASYSINRSATLFNDVAKIVFSNTDANSNNTFDNGENTGIITVGQVTGSYPVWGGNNDLTAVTTTSISAGQNKFSDVWINTDATGGFWGSSIASGSQQYKVLLEETIHALGVDLYRSENLENSSLSYDISTNPLLSNLEQFNSQKYTVTSYFSAPEMGGSAPWTLQLYDIAALQEIYGRNYTKLTSDTVYTADGAGGTLNMNSTSSDWFMYTIWDGGGIDTIDASTTNSWLITHPVQIDLRQGHFSSIGYDSFYGGMDFDADGVDNGNVAIAFHSVIENAIGTDGNDILIGNQWSNRLEGGAGNDTLYGSGYEYDEDFGFMDVDADDALDPNRSWAGQIDVYVGGEGNDVFHANTGFNSRNTLDYSGDLDGVAVDFESHTVTDGWGDTDTLVGVFQNVLLTGYDDTLNTDVVHGGVLDGAGGTDTINYESAWVFDEHTNTVYSIEAEDHISNFEDVTFSGYVTILPDETVDRTLTTGANYDYSNSAIAGDFEIGTYYGHPNLGSSGTFTRSVGAVVTFDDDIVHEGSISYSSATMSYNDWVNYSDYVPWVSIEGTNHGDHVTMDEFQSFVRARTGFVAGRGDDHIEILIGNGGSGVLYTGGNDVIEGTLKHLSIAQPIRFEQMSVDSIIENSPGSGSYHVILDMDAYGSIEIDLNFNSSGDLASGTRIALLNEEKLLNININGTISYAGDTNVYDDFYSGSIDTKLDDNFFAGTTGDNILYGYAGNDTIYGGKGNDTIYGGSGDDRISGGAGDDVIIGGLGADIFAFETGSRGSVDIFQDFDQYEDSILLPYITQGYIAGVSDLDDFVRITSEGHLLIDLNGGGDSFEDFAIIEGYVASTTAQSLLDSGHLVVLSDPVPSGTNHDPVTQNDTFTIDENASLIGNVFEDNGDGADEDPDYDIMFVTAGSFTTDHGSIEISSNGNFVYTPDEDYAGSDSFEYTVTEGRGGEAVGLILINIGDPVVNIAPIANDDDFIGEKNQNTLGYLLSDNGHGADSDADSDTLTVTAGTYATAHGSVVVLSDGSFTYTPATDYTGHDSFTYTVNDGHGGTDTAKAGIDVYNYVTGATSGNNTLGGTSDNDLIHGLGGNDTLNAAAGNDLIFGDDGNDNLYGGLGDDVLNGGNGTDTATYVDFTSFSSVIVVDLSITGAQDTHDGGVDTFINIENVVGGNGTDILAGNDGNNKISGGNGNDFIYATAGDDTLDGGGGYNTVSFERLSSGVDVNLMAYSSTSSEGTNFTVNFIHMIGSDYDDRLLGDYASNNMTGGSGADTFAFAPDTSWLENWETTVDTVTDFNVSEGDILDISGLIAGTHPDQYAIDDFVTFTTSGGNTTMSVDRDGTGGTYTAQAIATLSGVTGLDAETLMANGNMVA